MRSLKTLVIGAALAAIFGVGGATSPVSAQDTMLGKAGDAVTKTSKKVYTRGKRVGHTVGTRTWNGSKWVATKSYRGGRWVAVKTVNGTKWVYRKGKGVVVGNPRRP